MFNNAKIDRLEYRVNELHDLRRREDEFNAKRYWDLNHQIDAIAAHLGIRLVENETPPVPKYRVEVVKPINATAEDNQ